MLMTAGIIVAILLIALALYVAAQPGTFRVERRAHINATPAAIFPLLVDFHRWSVWSPWEGLDPAMTRRHSGAESGKGAVYEWEGNKKVGSGRMEMLETAAPSHLVIKLDFLKPFEAHNFTEFALTPADGGTDVTWSTYGPQSVMTKVMGLVMSMDTLIGKDFERGLTNLKRAMET